MARNSSKSVDVCIIGISAMIGGSLVAAAGHGFTGSLVTVVVLAVGLAIAWALIRG